MFFTSEKCTPQKGTCFKIVPPWDVNNDRSLNHFNLRSSTDFSLMYPFLIILAFRDVRNVPLLSHDNGTINYEDFLVLNDFFFSKKCRLLI